MPDPATGISAGVGLLGAGISGSEARESRRDATQASADELAFAQEQYDDWMAIYGPIQENLAQYYGGVTPEYYEVQGLEAFEQEQEATLTSLQESLAQRGISDSGIAAALETQVELGGAQERAKIRAQAPAMAAEEQLRFLQVGLGQDPSSSLAQTLGRQTQMAEQRATSAEIAAGEAIGTGITTAGTALADYYRDTGGDM